MGSFFVSEDDYPSSAAELAEQVIRAVSDDPQERKAPYYARLLANAAFRSDIPPATCHLLINLAQQISYTQICFLAVATQEIAYRQSQQPSPNIPPRHRLRVDTDLALSVRDHQFLRWDWEELRNLNLAEFEHTTGDPQVRLYDLSVRGEVLAELIELSGVPADELRAASVIV